MSAIANLSSIPAALASVNVRPHGHRKGVHMDSAADSGSSTAAQVPAATAQNLFGTLLASLEQVIGVQLTPPTSPTPATATPAAPAATGATAAAAGPTATPAGTPAASTANAVTATSVGKLLQNYLNNVRNLQDGSAAPTAAGTNVRSA